jgi:acyl CoA:acetate/3-ketoacid CoA transferase
MEFTPVISDDLKTMDPLICSRNKLGLDQKIEK